MVVVLLIPALSLLGLGVLFHRMINSGAVSSMELRRSWVHSEIRKALHEDPQARSSVLVDTLHRHLGRENGIYVLRASNSGSERVELLVSLLDAQSRNEFVGHDWVACIRADVTAGDAATITSTDAACPADVVFTDLPQEEHSTWGYHPGVPADAYVVHLPPRREGL
ncbi:MAG TPA: hypothetical protein VFP72_06030 [Kineosporiaceae bacterium]|nr:hypothetical protein [Kineosporiaceae bacterium]